METNKGWETTRGPRSEVRIAGVVVDSSVLARILRCWCIHLGVGGYASDLVRGMEYGCGDVRMSEGMAGFRI